MDLLVMMWIYVRVVECGMMFGVVWDFDMGQLVVSECIDKFEKFFGIWLLMCSVCMFNCMEEGCIFYVCSKELFEVVEDMIVVVLKIENMFVGMIWFVVV